MRPSAIPDEEVWAGATRKVIAAPDGDLLGESGIEPVEALTEIVDGTPMFHVRMVLDDLDVARIKSGERVFWYTQHGTALRPFSLGMPAKVFPVCRNCHQALVHSSPDLGDVLWFHEHPDRPAPLCQRPEPLEHP